MVDEIDKKARELADRLTKASDGLQKPFKGLVDNLAEVNKEIAISAADIRKDTRDTFSGFLSKRKLAKAMEDYDKTELERNKARSEELDSHEKELIKQSKKHNEELESSKQDFIEQNKKDNAEVQAAKDAILKEEEVEINRNQNLNAMKKSIAEKEQAIQNNLNNKWHGSVEANIEKQKEIEAIQQKVDAKETEIKKFRAAQMEKVNDKEQEIESAKLEFLKKNSEQVENNENARIEASNAFKEQFEDAEQERIRLEEQFTEDMKKASSSERFDNFSGAIKDLTGGLLDIGGMLDDVTKFGNNLKTVGTEFKNFGMMLGDKLGNPVDKLKDLFWGLVASAGAFFTTMKSSVGEKFKSAKESITGKISNVKEKGGAVKDMFSEKAELFQGKMSDLGNTMKNGAKTMGGKGLKAIKMAPKMLMKGATRFVSLLARIPMMLAAIPAILSSPFVLIGAAVLLLAIGLVLVWMKFKDSIMEKFEAMKTKVTEVVTNIVDGFLDVWQKVKDWFSDKVFGIRSFLGLTSEEEEAEHAKQEVIKEKEKEKERLKEEQKEIALQAKEAEIDAQLKAEYGEDALNWGWGRGDSDAKDKKKQMMEQAEAEIDEDIAMDDISSEALLEERNQSKRDYDNVEGVIDARQEEVENKVKFSNLKINGEDATEEQKREFYQERADKGQLDGQGKLRNFEGTKGITTEELKEIQAAEMEDRIKAQKELDTREDYVPLNRGDNATIARRNELQGKQADEEIFNDGDGLTEKEKMELTRLERDQGDRIKDSADRAKEMGPKRPDPSITSVAQQNTNNNVTNNTISASPNPRPTDNTINRTATVNQN